ncbi:putative indole-3-acetic acid-induced protein ARG7 [Iris pallida]|uniref:Indole-3-acetic acid-induced protein ARG7 n=1 Tax=Iris pallida TaxID=29817 RepID=A0AAX6EEF4_IRIPA|nr:putative indole-3-acetic acid-induced protein ARG7 [Iris pallida]
MGMGMGKCSKIRHIVRLRQMLRRWRLRAASRCAPSDVPAGHVAVCVGSSSRRFVVRAAHLNHPVFRQLLSQAEEEYGFSSQPGPLSLPCDESLFEQVLRHISSTPNSPSGRFANHLEVDIHNSSSCCCCHVRLRSQWQPDTLPLLRGLAEKSVW